MEVVKIAESAIAGVSAALTATLILGIAKWLYRWWLKHRDVKYIRAILIEGQALVLGAKETFHEGADVTSSADRLRAAQYNNMIRKLRVALEQWAVNLSHPQRRDVFDALNWFHTEGLLALRMEGEMEYVQVSRWRMAYKGYVDRSGPGEIRESSVR